LNGLSDELTVLYSQELMDPRGQGLSRGQQHCELKRLKVVLFSVALLGLIEAWESLKANVMVRNLAR